MKWRILQVSMIGLLAFSLTGCPPKKQVKKEEPKPEEQAKPVEEPSLRGKDYKEVPEIATIYFDLDQATLRAGCPRRPAEELCGAQRAFRLGSAGGRALR